MKVDHGRLHYLLQQYANNECSEAEMQELFAMIAASKDNALFSDELLSAWNSIDTADHKRLFNGNELFREIQDRISVSSVKTISFNWWKAAAVFLVVVSVAVLYFINAGKKKDIGVASTVRKEFAKPEHKLLRLPDGSTVLLNNNSTLEVPPSFAGRYREVTLKGEGFFDIQTDTAHPFIIHTVKLTTRVLGTSFNIRAYSDETDVIVTVTKGQVKVESEDRLLGILTPNQQISFNRQSNASVQQQVLTDSVIVWKENDLLFDNITFEEAAKEISKRYNVRIFFEKENMKSCRFHASFLNEYQVEQVLTVLCDLNRAEYEIKDNIILIKGEGCN